MLYLRTVYEKEKLKGDRVKPDPPFKKPKNLQIWGSKILLFIKKKKIILKYEWRFLSVWSRKYSMNNIDLTAM